MRQNLVRKLMLLPLALHNAETTYRTDHEATAKQDSRL